MKSYQPVQCVRCNFPECLVQAHRRKKRKWTKGVDNHPCFNCGFPVWYSWDIWQKVDEGTVTNVKDEVSRVMDKMVESWMAE